jgi:hypothetical protein
MNGQEKSDPAKVAGKPTNKAERSAAEPVDQGRGPRGMRASKARAGRRTGKACHRRWNAYAGFAVRYPRWEPYARIGPVRICAGGTQQ